MLRVRYITQICYISNFYKQRQAEANVRKISCKNYSFLPNDTHDCKKDYTALKQSKMHRNVNFSGTIRQISVALRICSGVINNLNGFRTLWEPCKFFYTRVFHLEVESINFWQGPQQTPSLQRDVTKVVRSAQKYGMALEKNIQQQHVWIKLDILLVGSVICQH